MAEYIEREAAYEKCGWYNTVNGKSVYAVRKDELAAIPTADVELVRHGRWIVELFKEPVCSYCEKTLYIARFSPHNYCPNCGAKMDLELNYV